jgi:hypothetical protein
MPPDIFYGKNVVFILHAFWRLAVLCSILLILCLLVGADILTPESLPLGP